MAKSRYRCWPDAYLGNGLRSSPSSPRSACGRAGLWFLRGCCTAAAPGTAGYAARAARPRSPRAPATVPGAAGGPGRLQQSRVPSRQEVNCSGWEGPGCARGKSCPFQLRVRCRVLSLRNTCVVPRAAFPLRSSYGFSLRASSVLSSRSFSVGFPQILHLLRKAGFCFVSRGIPMPFTSASVWDWVHFCVWLVARTESLILLHLLPAGLHVPCSDACSRSAGSNLHFGV